MLRSKNTKGIKTKEIWTHPDLAQKAYHLLFRGHKILQKCKMFLGINPSSVPCATKQTPVLIKTHLI